MNYKKFVKSFVIIFITIVLFVGIVNFIVDPLWMFKSTQGFDIKQKDFNERVQKTNYLAFKDNNFDAVLLGNSRVTYINQNDFNIGVKVFNYAVNAMPSSEYDSAIENFVKLTNKEPKIILLGIELFNIGLDHSNVFEEAFDNTRNGWGYKFNNLFSYDTLLFSFQNLYTTYKGFDRKQRFYNKFLEKGSKEQNIFSNKEYIKGMMPSGFNKRYDRKVLAHFKGLKNKYKNSRFIVFTMPVHSDLFKIWSNDKKFVNYYSLWLKDLVSLFGNVNHFFYDSKVSDSYYNFFDAFHFYPFVGKKIAQKISNHEIMNDNDDFGILLTKENIDEYLKQFNKGKN